MIKNLKETRAVRECKCAWDFRGEDGKVASKEITVNYFSPTIADLKQQRIEAKQRAEQDKNAMVWLSEELVPLLHSLTDLPAGVEAPSPVTVEWLEVQDLPNLVRIREAIDENLNVGKSRPAR